MQAKGSHTNNIFNNFSIYDFIEEASNKISECAFVKRAAARQQNDFSFPFGKHGKENSDRMQSELMMMTTSMHFEFVVHNMLYNYLPLLVLGGYFFVTRCVMKCHQQRHENLS